MSSSRVVSPASATSDRQDRILRYTLAERINHWIAAASYIYCLMTGLAFWSPYMFWLATLAGGGPTAQFWHPWMGLVYTASSLWMYRLWRWDMRTHDVDRAWWKSVKYYIRNQDENLPAVGRFNYGQKQFFWLMFYGTILLLLSGIVLWFTDSVPWTFRWLRYLAVVTHVTAAWATIGGFIIHVYMGTAMVRGSFSAIVRGEVSTAWAKMHHRLWYEQVTRKKFPQP
jgi:formate dehydrogenase subunit gamma